MLMKSLNRRKFLADSAKVAAGLGIAPMILDKRLAYLPSPEENAPQALEYRTLGKTGLKVTAISFGAMITREASVLHRALDLGINYVDTARYYQNGNNEVMVGGVLKNRRKDVILATKILPGLNTETLIMQSFEKSLKALGTDYVDIIQLHAIQAVSQIQHEETLATLQKIKKEGKARFIGFTTHQNEIALLEAAAPMNVFDTILIAYNFTKPDLEHYYKAIENASKAGIGLIAMKTQAGGYTEEAMGSSSPHQAALKWVLQNKYISNAIPSMTTFAQVEENIKVMNASMGWQDRKTLHRYGQAIDKKLCRMCNACSGQCPKGVNLFDTNRALMYHQGYGEMPLARQTWNTIPLAHRPDACSSCKICVVKCPQGLNVRDKMREAVTLFA